MSMRLAVLILCLGGLVSRGAEPSSALPRSTPEAQGVPSSAITAFLDRAERDIDALHSVMIVRHGLVIAEGWWAPHAAGTRHELYSLSKSFTSTAVGFAVAEGLLSVDDPVLSFFPDLAPADPSNHLKSMRLSDLLRMATGHQTEPPRPLDSETNWVQAFLAHPVPFKPGTHFLYNTSATYVASAIVQKATGQTVLDYLRPRLFEPLGIVDPLWGTSPQGISLGGYGLSVRTEDIAKFGQLYLQKGRWKGKQLLPEAWAEAATARQTSNGSNPASDWDQGYGYQFWRCRYGAYRGDGAFGQFCVVLPEQDAVIAITGGVRDLQSVLNLVWETLLPAFGPSPRPDDPAAHDALKTRLAGLTLKPVDGPATSPTSDRVRGKVFAVPPSGRKIEAISLESDGEAQATLVLRIEGQDHRIPLGHGTWRRDRVTLEGLPSQPGASCYAWTSDDTLTAKVCLVETPFIVTLRLTFRDDTVRLESEANVGFGPTRRPAIEGRTK